MQPSHAGPPSQIPTAHQQHSPLVPLTTAQAGGVTIDYLSLLSTLVKWRLMILSVVLGAIVLAVAYTLFATPLFRSTATIEIAEAPVQVVEVGGVQEGESASSQFFTTQLGLLRSVTLAERTARQFNRSGGRENADALTGSQIAANLTITPQANSRLVNITFVSENPQRAAQIPNMLAENFVASNVERRYETTAFARKFLENRIALVKKRLEASERQLVSYAQKEQIVNVGGDDADGGTSLNSASLGLINTSLATAQADRVTAQQNYEQARARATQSVNADPTVQGLRAQRIELEAEYQDKLAIYKPDFPAQVRLRERIEGLERSIAQASTRVATGVIADARADYSAALGRERQLAAQVGRLKSTELDLRGRSIDYNILRRDLDTNRVLYDGLLQRYKEVGVAAGVGNNLISVVDPAKVPGGPFTPNLLLNLLIAVLCGLAIGVGTAFAIELLSDRVATPEDVEKRLDVPLLGVVPDVPRPQSFLDAIGDTRSGASEAYVSIRTTLKYASMRGLPRTLLVTGAQAAEGKSSTSYALSVAFAKLGMRTLLIDADMRNPSLGGKKSDRIGFSDLLTGNDNFAESIQSLKADNLWLIGSGPIPPAPAELLASSRLKEVLDHLSGMFDIVVIDSPPVLGLADAPLLAAYCQTTLLVCRANGSRRQVITAAIRRLRATGAQILGVVLTRYKASYSGYGDAYGYSYSYGGKDKTDERTLLIGENSA